MNYLSKMSGIMLVAALFIATSCKKQGCTDPVATNYSLEAKKDDGSCQYKTINPNDNTPSTPSFIKALFLSNRTNNKQTFNINASVSNQLITTKGILLSIPKNTFVNESNVVVSGNVTVEVIELMNQPELIWYGINTMSNDKILETGGGLLIKAYANGQELGLASSKSIAIEIPSSTNKPSMSIYYGIETKNEIGDVYWSLADSLGYPSTVTYGTINYCDTIYTSTQNLDSVTVSGTDSLGNPYTYDSTFYAGPFFTTLTLDCSNPIQAADQGYVFSIKQLGWISCARESQPTGITSKLKVLTPPEYTGANTKLFLHFSNLNAVTTINYTGINEFETAYTELSVGDQLTIVALAEIEGVYYRSITPITVTNNHSESITFTTSTLADMKQTIDNL